MNNFTFYMRVLRQLCPSTGDSFVSQAHVQCAYINILFVNILSQTKRLMLYFPLQCINETFYVSRF